MPAAPRILIVIGTRPEAIKMAPVVHALRDAGQAEVRVVVTAQHRELLDDQLTFFGIAPDRDLDAMRQGQDLTALTATLLRGLDEALVAERPALVLAQGDTTTVLATAIACFHRRIPFGHVEAGLRTGDLAAPFPEEMNRALADRVATLRFAPTEAAAAQLRGESITGHVLVTGNTVIDALLWTRARSGAESAATSGKRRLLVTVHRRESFGAPLASICAAVRQLADRGDVEVLLPVHPNPEVQRVVTAALGAHPAIRLEPPLGYQQMVDALAACHLVLTDSGGLQEEAPALGKPVLVLRDTTERPEGVAAGVARLVGTDPASIVAAATRLLDDPDAHAAMARVANPYGDGRAAPRIAAACLGFLRG
ncbi:MAG: UDP-N-acetylglucosamine 2-epimerase (non-hydrolyzing) [Planctomycetota bacterium]